MYLIDVSIPNSHNIRRKEAEKVEKYGELAMEVKRIWQVDSVVVVPIVISATGVISRSFHEHVRKLGLSKDLYSELQKITILQTTNIVRAFLAGPEL